MALSPSEVARLAALARIDLTDEELAELAPQLDVILDAVAAVSRVASPDVVPMSHALPLTNVFRPDAAEDGRFRVPRVLDEEA